MWVKCNDSQLINMNNYHSVTSDDAARSGDAQMYHITFHVHHGNDDASLILDYESKDARDRDFNKIIDGITNGSNEVGINPDF
jgi:hypothetical protein